MKREHIVLALVILIIVAVFVLSLAVGGGDGRADPEDSDGIEALQDALASLPGFGNSLDADDVQAGCFDRATKTFRSPAAPDRCQFDVPDGVDDVPLRVIEGDCAIRITRQPDTFDQETSTAEWSDRRKDLALVGEGARISISGECRLRLD